MSTGGGNSFLESALDIGINVATGGGFGYKDDKGGVTWGEILGPTMEGIKEVTGAKAAEEANEDARKRFTEEKANAEQKRKDNQALSARDELQKSRSAGNARGGVKSSASKGNSRFSDLGTDEQDFLGL